MSQIAFLYKAALDEREGLSDDFFSYFQFYFSPFSIQSRHVSLSLSLRCISDTADRSHSLDLSTIESRLMKWAEIIEDEWSDLQ